jgi:hypothetical protein
MKGRRRNKGRKDRQGTKTGEQARGKMNEMESRIESKLEMSKIKASCDVTDLTGNYRVY